VPCQVQYSGYVKWYNEAKGYGFVTKSATKDDYFFHVKSVPQSLLSAAHLLSDLKNYSTDSFTDILPHTRVKFNLEVKKKGKAPEAVEIEVFRE
jgi:cold shock CspA family protein